MKRLPQRSAVHRGFTLIEVMIVVAIVAILAAVAYPGYRDYIIRSHLVDGTNGLSSMQAEMERYYQDNRRYDSVNSTTIVSPCSLAVATRTFGDFVVTCNPALATNAQTYTLRATGSGTTNLFIFTIDQNRNRATIGAPPGWTGTGACWLIRKGQTC